MSSDPTLRPRARLALLAACAMLFSCGEGDTTAPLAQEEPGPGISAEPHASITGDAHAGNPYFRWLPPMGTGAPGARRALNESLLPAVEICEWSGSGAWSESDCAPRARFTRTGSQPAGAPEVDVVDDHFQVDWDTDLFPVDYEKLYRLRVLVGSAELGHVDVAFGANGREARRKTAAGIFGVVHGRTLPLKFSISSGALCWPDPSCEQALAAGELLETTLTPDGGTFLVPSGHAGVAFEPGAVGEDVTLMIFRHDVEDANECLPTSLPQFEGCYSFSTIPRVDEFDPPAVIGACHEAAAEPFEALLQLHKFDPENPAGGVTALESVPLPFALACEEFRGRDLQAPGGHNGKGALASSFSTIGSLVPVEIRKVRGDNQTEAPGATLPVRPTVEVLGVNSLSSSFPGQEADPVPMPDVDLVFLFQDPDGAVMSTLLRTTGPSGLASAPWILGDEEGVYTLQVTLLSSPESYNDPPPAIFTATAEVPPPIGLNTITGTVSFSTTPLADVTVELIRWVDDPWVDAATGSPLQSTTTDGSGAFSFPDVEQGVYLVTAHGPTADFIPWKAVIADVGGGLTWTIDVGLPKLIQQLTPADGATVTTQTPELTWAPIPEAETYNVLGRRVGIVQFAWFALGITSSSFTPEDPLQPVSLPYRWFVEAFDAAGNHVGTSFGGSLGGPDACPLHPSERAICAPTETFEFTVDPISVTGTLFYSTDGLSGVTIELVQGDPADPAVFSTTTGLDGGFALHSVPDGSYWLRADGPSADAALGLPSGTFIGVATTEVTVAGADVSQDLDLPKTIELLPPEDALWLGDGRWLLPQGPTQARLSWTPNEEAWSYQIRVWHTDSGMLVEEQWTSSASYTTGTLEEGEDYHWAVEAWDAAGHHVGATEEPARFLVPVPVH